MYNYQNIIIFTQNQQIWRLGRARFDERTKLRAAARTGPRGRNRCILFRLMPAHAGSCGIKTWVERNAYELCSLKAHPRQRSESTLVSNTAVATNAKIAKTLENTGAGCLLAVKASQPSLRAGTPALSPPPALTVSLNTARTTTASKSRPSAS